LTNEAKLREPRRIFAIAYASPVEEIHHGDTENTESLGQELSRRRAVSLSVLAG